MNFPMDINFGLAGEGLWGEEAHEAEHQEQESAGRKVIGVDKKFQLIPDSFRRLSTLFQTLIY